MADLGPQSRPLGDLERVPEGGLTPTPLEDELRARLERLLARPRPAVTVGANVGES